MPSQNAEIDLYFSRLEPGQEALFRTLRQLILDTHPAITEKYAYKIPFYYLNGWCCYLTVLKGNHAVLGFCNGYLMADPCQWLRSDAGQKMVRHLYFESPYKPDYKLIQLYLHEAAQIALQKK